METNRDYISWSAYSLWKSSKFSFYKKYVLGEEVKTPAFDKGKEFSKYRETQQLPPYEVDPLLAPVSKSIPIIGEAEHKIEVDFIDSKLLCYIDEVKDDKTHFNEYKTGKIPWDNIQVSQHEQLPFYALCMYLKYNIIPTCTLYWIETEEVEINGEKLIRYTGQVESFERKFTEEDLINFGTILNKTLIEIKEYEFEELECDLDIASKYIELTKQKKHIESQIELIKMQMHEEFISTGCNTIFL